jgi:hypothetical protein
MVKRGALTVPVIGVAHSAWDLEQLGVPLKEREDLSGQT